MVKVTRKVRKGRSVDPSTLAAIATLEKAWKAKAREDLPIIAPDGSVTETLKAVVVTPTLLGKPEGFTGIPGLVSKWAKDNGHSVRCLKCDDGEFAIVAKG